jgi:hypothetical protein
MAAEPNLSLADHSAPTPCHEGEGQNSGESGGVLDLLRHGGSPLIVLPSFYSLFVLMASGFWNKNQ